MPDIGQNGAVSNAVAAQAVGDEASRLVAQPAQQSLEEALGSRPTPPALHKDVQHHPVLVHCAPEIMQHAIDPNEHLVEVPCVPGPGSPPPEPSGEVRTKLPAPVSDALVGDEHAALGQDQLDIPQTEAEYVIQLGGVADDLGREAMPRIRGGRRWRHPVSLA